MTDNTTEQQRIEAGNKTIAKFMGYEKIMDTSLLTDDISELWIENKETRDINQGLIHYHTSWDLLMPVWEKCIEVIGIWCVTHSDNNKANVWYEASETIGKWLSSVNLTSAHSEIGHLIQWYNNQTKEVGND